MMKLRSCIWPTMMPGSNTRDFSSAKPNTMPMSDADDDGEATDMTDLPLRCGAAAASRWRCRRRTWRRPRQSSRPQLRHAGQAVAAGAAVGDTRAEQHQEAADERDGVTFRRRRRAERTRPDRRDRLASRARQLHRSEGADGDADDQRDLPPVLAGGGDVAGDVVDLEDRRVDPRGNQAADGHVGRRRAERGLDQQKSRDLQRGR